jgi:O-antigen ligase
VLTWLKSLLAGILVPAVYAGVFFAFTAAVIKRAEWALYLLAILIPLPVVWYRAHSLPLGSDIPDILILGSILGIFINKNGFQRAPSMMLVGTFMVVSYLALWNASSRFGLPAPLSTDNPLLADWKNYAEMIFLYFIVYGAIRNEKEQKTVVVIMATVILLIVLREFRNFTEGMSFSYGRRAEGPFWIVGLGANHFGAFIAHYGALLLGLFLVDKHKYRKWLYLAAVVISVHPLFFAYSRGAYAAALAAVVLFGLVKKRSLLVLVGVLIFAWQVILPTTVVERIAMTESSSGEIEDSALQRLVMWQYAVQFFEDNIIFGVGFNGFGLALPAGSRLTDTHNFYLKTAAEQGMVGLVMLAAVLLVALSSGWRLYRRGQSDFHRGLGLGFVGCVVAVLVSNIFGDRWSYFALGGYFWIAWGLVDGALKLSQEQAIAASVPAAEPRQVPGYS